MHQYFERARLGRTTPVKRIGQFNREHPTFVGTGMRATSRSRPRVDLSTIWVIERTLNQYSRPLSYNPQLICGLDDSRAPAKYNRAPAIPAQHSYVFISPTINAIVLKRVTVDRSRGNPTIARAQQ
jgi:hypothetical protein